MWLWFCWLLSEHAKVGEHASNSAAFFWGRRRLASGASSAAWTL